MISMGGDISPLEIDDEWYRILSVEEESFCRQVDEGRFVSAPDNGEVSIVTNSTPHRTTEPPHRELSSDFEELEEILIGVQEGKFDTEEGLPSDFEDHDEIITATDGDEFHDDDEEFIIGTDGDACDDDDYIIPDIDGDEFNDQGERPRDFGESMELSREEEEDLFRYYEEMMETYSGEYEISDPQEGRSGIQWLPRQIKDFLQTLPRIETGTLRPDDLKCAICQSEFGEERGGDDGETSSESVQGGLPGQESAEYPVKLPCGHFFGLWCIETWLLNAEPASCPLCRYLFQPL